MRARSGCGRFRGQHGRIAHLIFIAPPIQPGWLKATEMMKPYPTYRQREVLQFLMSGDWVPILRLIPVGEKLLGNLLQAGWIERSLDVKTGDLYRITEAGRTAFRTPVPIR